MNHDDFDDFGNDWRHSCYDTVTNWNGCDDPSWEDPDDWDADHYEDDMDSEDEHLDEWDVFDCGRDADDEEGNLPSSLDRPSGTRARTAVEHATREFERWLEIEAAFRARMSPHH